MIRDVDLDTTLAGEEEGQIVAGRVRELIGVSEGAASSEEGFWAVRRLCEALARERPLVLLFEDLHWGEPTLLDLIAHLDERAQGPILLLSAARLELREKRPSWAEAALTLEPLPEDDSQMLVTSLPGGAGLLPEARTRILETASGNPLFVEQLFAYVEDEGAEESTTPIPPTINALLTARLDALPEAERVVLERASVEGKIFQRESLVELTPERLRPTIGEHLTALVRKGLVQPERPAREAETLRFHHDLVRDAAYGALPKRTRAELHERLADWLETHAATPDEVVGYHLEQSVRCREQLAPLDEHDLELATRAGRKLTDAGFRARARGDISGTRHLHERAISLLPTDSAQRVELLIELRADEALQAARAHGDRRLELRALVVQATKALTETSSLGATEGMIVAAEQAIRLFEDVRDESGLAKAWRLLCYVYSHRGKTDAAIHAALCQIEHAQQVTDGYETPIFDQLIEEHVVGRTPVPEALLQLSSSWPS